jgi:hypothetical protein
MNPVRKRKELLGLAEYGFLTLSAYCVDVFKVMEFKSHVNMSAIVI